MASEKLYLKIGLIFTSILLIIGIPLLICGLDQSSDAMAFSGVALISGAGTLLVLTLYLGLDYCHSD